MSREHTGTNRERSEYYGALQDIVNALFAQYGDLDPTIAEAVGAKVRRLDVVVDRAWGHPRESLRGATVPWRPTSRTSFCASSRCARLATTRASACAPS